MYIKIFYKFYIKITLKIKSMKEIFNKNKFYFSITLII